MADLFTTQDVPGPARRSYVPLAERIRPRSVKEFIGQSHLLGEGKPLRVMIEKGELFSMILWGPPGVGKTTLARLVAHHVQADFYQLNAVSSGVKDVREVIGKAERNLNQRNKRTILFIDEIHRFNKAQQDALLHSVEDGSIVLIGATTENPSFEVIAPLLSRCRVYVLEALDQEGLSAILERALINDAILSKRRIVIEDRDFLMLLSGGDARKLLNGLETALQLTKPDADGGAAITKAKKHTPAGSSAALPA